jgi:hypothetical protein
MNNAFPINSVPISGELHLGIFTTQGYSGIDKHREPTPPHVRALRTMNRGVMRNDMYENIARSIWEGKAIMGTDGSVKKSRASYSFVISMSKTNVTINVKGGGFLPTTFQYTDPYSKCTEAAALLAGLQWIQLLHAQNPNPTDSTPLPLLISIDNDSVVKDVHRQIDDQSPTFAQLASVLTMTSCKPSEPPSWTYPSKLKFFM